MQEDLPYSREFILEYTKLGKKAWELPGRLDTERTKNRFILNKQYQKSFEKICPS